MHETFRAEYVRCGKPSCRSCPHGPYWYAYHKEGGRTRKRYVGKDRPDLPRQEDPEEAIFNSATATPALARKILGISPGVDKPEAKKAFRKLSMELHPDRGGDEQRFKKVNSAWSYLCACMGW